MTDNLHAPLGGVGITQADRQAAKERLDTNERIAWHLFTEFARSDFPTHDWQGLDESRKEWWRRQADDVQALTDCGHHSWSGLMALLDEHWPEDVFPTRTDHPDRDPGPRIVSLIRMVDRLQARIGALRMLEAALRQGPPPPPQVSS
jgi:hypothetical protein